MSKQHSDGCIKCPDPPRFLFTLLSPCVLWLLKLFWKTIEIHVVISVARVNFRTRKFIEMERITVEIISKNLNNSDSQHKYDDIRMWLIFFVGRSSHLIGSCSPWTALLDVKRSPLCWYFLQFRKLITMQAFPPRTSQTPGLNCKQEQLHFKTSKEAKWIVSPVMYLSAQS